MNVYLTFYLMYSPAACRARGSCPPARPVHGCDTYACYSLCCCGCWRIVVCAPTMYHGTYFVLIGPLPLLLLLLGVVVAGMTGPTKVMTRLMSHA